jgi:hypothetical protein
MISKTMNTKSYQLWELCRKHIHLNMLLGEELIGDMERQDLHEFIKDICELVGYEPEPTDHN